MRNFLLPIAALLIAAPAFATTGVTYEGRVFDSNDNPIVDSAVQFKIQIRSPGNENCLLYEEVQTLNLSATDGYFAITLNDGSGTRTDSSNYSFTNIFSNRSTFSVTTSSCSSGNSYTPNTADGRNTVIMMMTSTDSSFTAMPTFAINYAPMAINSLAVGGFGPTNLLRVDDVTANSNLTPLNTAQYNSLTQLISGTSTLYAQNATNGTTVLPSTSASPTNPAAGAIWYNSSTGSINFSNGTSTQTLSTSTSGGTSGTVNSGTANQLAYYSASGTGVSGLTSLASSVLLTNSAGVPSWVAASSDNFTSYALLTGRTGGQSLSGGSSAGNNLTLDSTSNAAKGSILLAPNGGTVGIGTYSPGATFAVSSSSSTSGSSSYAEQVLMSVAPATGGSNSYAASDSELSITSSSGTLTGVMSGATSVVTNNNSGQTATIIGRRSTASHAGSGTLTNAYGALSVAQNSGSSTISMAVGSKSVATNAGSGTLAQAIGVEGTVTSTGGSVNNAYALYADTPIISGGTLSNAYGLYIAPQTAAVQNYALYSGGGLNIFVGKVGIGTTSPGAMLDIMGHTANSGPSATVSSCGTSPTLVGNDTRGTVTLGSGNPTSCQITFATAYLTPPICVMTAVAGDPGAIRWWVNALQTSFTMNFSLAPTSGQQFNYHCMQ